VKRFAKHGMTLWVLCSFVLALAVGLPTTLGLERYVIVGDSMTGAIPKGSIVYARVVPVDQLRAGDIITFVAPGQSAPVTHRVTAITQAADGQLVFKTKGDFNQAADPWNSTFLQSSAARYEFHIPLLGYALAAFSIREVRMLLIALPALLISLSILWSIWRAAAESVRRHEAESVGFHDAGSVGRLDAAGSAGHHGAAELTHAIARLRLCDEEAGA
jgi:signal peptidase